VYWVHYSPLLWGILGLFFFFFFFSLIVLLMLPDRSRTSDAHPAAASSPPMRRPLVARGRTREASQAPSRATSATGPRSSSPMPVSTR
jgi:hypothetical protein